ncbi:MAG TPA: siderophore-interacting protein [Arachnia sp.]|nr:siderophore-interacting protein [Arachnia sp.]HMT85020.1 siderophore-interacting protein [Arachnia sp.]
MPGTLRPLTVFPITTRTLEVIRVRDVTPGMRRVTLSGPELAAHTAANGYPVAAFRSDGFDDEFKIILTHPDAAETVGPTQADGVLNWPRCDEHLLFRTYTVRRWDPIAGEIDVDFVKHGVGFATTWAKTVHPGESVQIAGPKSSSPHPVGADWTLVAGDETALPSIGRWLESWPEGARGQVFIEVARPEHRQDLPQPEGVEITWLSRDGAEPGTTTLLFDAIRAADWWEGTVFAWVSGETLSLTPIRRWLRNDKGLAKEQVEVTGYWRRQEVVVGEDEALPDLDATEDEEGRFHELSELLPAFAVRVASTIGLAAAFNGEPRTVAELAERSGADALGLAKLLRYLGAIGITEAAGEQHWRLTSLGRELEDDDIDDALHLEGLPAQRELGAALSLLSAVRTGAGDHARWFGVDWATRTTQDLVAQRVNQEADHAVYVAGAVAEAAVFDGAETVAIIGQGAGVFATALLSARPSVRTTVVAVPSEIEVLTGIHGTPDRLAYRPGTVLSKIDPSSDVVLLTEALRGLPDADAVYALRQASAGVAPGGTLLVFGDVLVAELSDEHDYEHDLIDFALTGGGARTHDEYLALFTAAGLPGTERTTVGWGYSLYVTKP